MVNLNIFDQSGRLVKTLVDNNILEAGYNETSWNGCDEQVIKLSSGFYFYTLTSEESSVSSRMILLR